MATYINIAEPSRATVDPNRFSLWELGFRPFYLLASSFTALSIVLWALQYSGFFSYAYLQGPMWHAHEMIFGFVLPVIVGFLLTAGRSWSGLKTLNGWPLMMLALLWLVARVLILTPWSWAAAVANTLFPLSAAFALAVPFYKARAQRNYFLPGLLVLMAIVSTSIHATALGLLDFPVWLGIRLALDVVLFIIITIAGRVVPMFTNNGVQGAQAGRHPLLEKLAPASILALFLADAIQFSGAVFGVLLVVAGIIHGSRLYLWQPLKTFRNPLVWILHIAYAWIVVHLLLRSLFEFSLIDSSLATHALTTGVIGSITIGMMTRTAKGHTGRALKANLFDIGSFILIQAAAITRVFVPMLAPVYMMQSVLWAAVFWSAAYGLYAVRYWPVLTRARLDGKPG
ncbi:MAG: NnrS family protein [Granulosicoccus sp.]